MKEAGGDAGLFSVPASQMHAIEAMFARFVIALCFMISVPALAGPAGADRNPIPSVMAYRDIPAFWVAAECAIDHGGKLNVSILGAYGPSLADQVARRRDRLRRNPPDSSSASKWPELEGCESFFNSIPDHFEPTSPFAALIQHADFIVSARVLAMRQGFLGGMPGSLLLLSSDSLKGDAGDLTYLFYPLARIQTVEGPVCSKPLGSFAPPAVGDRLLLFSMGGFTELDGRRSFLVNTMRELVHESRNSRLLIPPALASLTPAAAPRFDDVVTAVREALAASHP